MTDPTNHGKAWLAADNETLKRMFNEGAEPEAIAVALQRKTTSVITQLERMHLLLRVGYRYHKVSADPWWDYRNGREKPPVVEPKAAEPKREKYPYFDPNNP